MGIPQEYLERIASDATRMQEGDTIPTPAHIALRKYAIETAEEIKSMTNTEAVEQIQKALQETLQAAEGAKKRDEEIKSSLPEHVRRMWGNANLGFKIVPKESPSCETNLLSESSSRLIRKTEEKLRNTSWRASRQLENSLTPRCSVILRPTS